MTLGRWVGRHVGATVLLAAIAVRLAVWASAVIADAPRQLAGRTPDDAYYFVVIGRNLADGLGPTFDGSDPTNGYQPLWQGVVAGLALVVPDGGLLQAALLLGGVLAVAGYVACARVMHSILALTPFGFALGLAVATGPMAWERTVNGMEGAVVVAAMALVALAARRWWAAPSGWTMGAVGAACGLLCLGRTTHVLTVAVVPLLLLWGLARSGRRVPVVRQLCSWAGAAAAVFLPWFAWSWVIVGSPTSSAGAIKTHWQQARTGSFPSLDALGQARLAGATELWRQVAAVAPFSYGWPDVLRRLVELLVIAAVAWAVTRLVRRRPVAVVVVAPAAAVLGRFAAELLWLPNLRAGWYSAPLFTLTGLAVAWLASWLIRRGSASPAALRVQRLPRPAVAVAEVAVGVVAALVVGHQAVRIPSDWGEANWAAAQEIRDLPPEVRVGSFDTGLLGFVRPGVVNLDGLVRGPGYVERATSGRPLGEVVLGEDLDVLVGRLEDGDGRLPSCAREVWSSPTEVVVEGRSDPVRIWSLDGCPR